MIYCRWWSGGLMCVFVFVSTAGTRAAPSAVVWATAQTTSAQRSSTRALSSTPSRPLLLDPAGTQVSWWVTFNQSGMHRDAPWCWLLREAVLLLACDGETNRFTQQEWRTGKDLKQEQKTKSYLLFYTTVKLISQRYYCVPIPGWNPF